MTRARVSRRRFLRGAGGALVALPFLETFALRGVRAQAPAPIRRFAVFFECNGVNMDHFWPTTPFGPLTEASFAGEATLQPLAAYRDRLLIPRGIHMVPRGFNRDPGPGDDHQKGMGCKLTAQRLDDSNDKYALGISVDQEIAARINPEGRPALTLLVGAKRSGATGHISYRGPRDPVMGENNPWLAYRDFMGLSNADPGVMDRLTRRRQSVLDLVREQMDALERQGLSRADREKLDLHYTSIRELEVGMGDAGLLACSLPAQRAAELEAIDPNTVAYDSEFKKIGHMQMDVMALALACDHTRVSTLQWGTGAAGPIFRWDGMNHDYNHHKLSHGETRDDGGEAVAGYLDMLHDIDRWFATQYAYLLDRLDAYDEGGASVLDNSAVVWMNELSHGKDHDFRDQPVVIAGSSAGYFRTGQYIKVTAQQNTKNDVDAPHNQLLTTFLNAAGARRPDGSAYENFGAYGKPGEMTMLKA